MRQVLSLVSLILFLAACTQQEKPPVTAGVRAQAIATATATVTPTPTSTLREEYEQKHLRLMQRVVGGFTFQIPDGALLATASTNWGLGDRKNIEPPTISYRCGSDPKVWELNTWEKGYNRAWIDGGLDHTYRHQFPKGLGPCVIKISTELVFTVNMDDEDYQLVTPHDPAKAAVVVPTPAASSGKGVTPPPAVQLARPEDLPATAKEIVIYEMTK